MRRYLAAVVTGSALLVSAAACGSDDDSAEIREACEAYQEMLNNWTTQYGAEVGAVGEADAAGDEGRRETAVAVVREIFTDSAETMRTEAEGVSDDELSDAFNDVADGLDEIAGQIETYQDVQAVPELMSEGTFAEGGQRISERCAEQ